MTKIKRQLIIITYKISAVIIGVTISLLLSGCESTFSIPYTKQPQVTQICVKVNWVSQREIIEKCGINKLACSTISSEQIPFSTIWAQKPENFNPENTCTIGHEFLHSLGADHK